MANPSLFEAFYKSLGPNNSPSNPNLYQVPADYTGSTPTTKLTSEGTNKAVKFLEEQAGQKIKVDFVNNIEPNTLGYFQPDLPGGGLYNSPEQGRQRTVFMGPGGGYETLFHEVGHTRDPGLRKSSAKEKSFAVDTILKLPTAAERFEYYANTKIDPRVNDETEAQAYMGFQLPRFATTNPELNINAQTTFNDPWFKEYPVNYAQKGIDQFYEAETGSNLFTNKQIKDNSPVALQVGRPTDPGLNALRLALDPELQTKQQALLDKTIEAVNSRLNPYQTNPTPVLDYWKPRY